MDKSKEPVWFEKNGDPDTEQVRDIVRGVGSPERSLEKTLCKETVGEVPF